MKNQVQKRKPSEFRLFVYMIFEAIDAGLDLDVIEYCLDQATDHKTFAANLIKAIEGGGELTGSVKKFYEVNED